MKKIKVFNGSTIDSVLEELDRFINSENITAYSFSHTYKKAKGNWANTYNLFDVELILIYHLSE